MTLKTLIIQNNKILDTHRQNISFYRKKHSPVNMHKLGLMPTRPLFTLINRYIGGKRTQNIFFFNLHTIRVILNYHKFNFDAP